MTLPPAPGRRTATLALTAAAALASVPLLAGPAAADSPHGFDVQAHRGGIALTVENTLPAFARALELGVSTLELDVQITEDGEAVVTHDRRISGTKCQDTAPAVPGDPEFPYVGDFVTTLTLAQVRTLDCGSLRQPAYPEQELAPGEPMPLLSEVFDLVRAYDARQVMLNIETKVEAGAPQETAPREQFVQVTADLVREARMSRQVTVQSFDWGALMRMQEVAPQLPVVALTNGQQFLQAGQPGASPWLGGLDIDDFTTGGRSLQEAYVAAVDSFGADAVSPVHGDPQNGSVDDPGYVPFTTPELVGAAHAAGMEVVPWTVNDRSTMEALVDIGVDGLITDRPDLLREVLAERGFRLPRSYELRGTGRP
jgi:glycerophosphoryl diester phosphodiesterase